MSADGSVIAFLEGSSGAWISTDSGATFAYKGVAAGLSGSSFTRTAMSLDGTKQVIVGGAAGLRDIWMSTDTGETWVSGMSGIPATTLLFSAVDMSSSGAIITVAAASAGTVYITYTGGVSWSEVTVDASVAGFSDVKMSTDDGQVQAVCGFFSTPCEGKLGLRPNLFIRFHP